MVVLVALALGLRIPGVVAVFTGSTGSGSTFQAAASFPTYSQQVLADAPWAYYRSDDAPSSSSTSTAADAAGTPGRPGTCNGATSGGTVAGAKVRWDFDTGSGTAVADSSWPPTATVISLSPPAAAKTDNATTLQYSYATNSWRFLMSHTRLANNVVATQLVDSGNEAVYNTWVHLAAVFNKAANTMKIYVNGVGTQITRDVTDVWSCTDCTVEVGRSLWGGS